VGSVAANRTSTAGQHGLRLIVKINYWLEGRCFAPKPDGPLQVMYGIDGRRTLTEETLDHLEGYCGSRPVRIGNGAYDQLQLDIYGEVLDAVYLYNKYGAPISYALWMRLRDLLNWICENWQRTDEGIWEVRSGRQHFVYSKLMCWVALDRGIRLADKRSFPAPRHRWLEARDQIYEDIMAHGWSDEQDAFVQHYGSDTLDAATLIMPLVFFVAPNDPRMLSTLDAINRPPREGGLVSNSLVYRYNVEKSVDGLTGVEGTFNMCSFWLIEALTRAGRFERSRLDAAHAAAEQQDASRSEAAAPRAEAFTPAPHVPTDQDNNTLSALPYDHQEITRGAPVSSPTPSMQEVWTSVLNAVPIPANERQVWLEPTALRALGEDCATIHAPNIFVRNRIAAHYHDQLAATLSAVVGRPLHIEVVTGSSGAGSHL